MNRNEIRKLLMKSTNETMRFLDDGQKHIVSDWTNTPTETELFHILIILLYVGTSYI